MEALFIRILNMSLTAGYCIVAVILLRFMLKRQAKILSYLLWSVVLFRLLCPFSFTSSYSLLRMDTGVILREISAGEWILNLMGGKGETVAFDSDSRATVRYTFADGSSVEIPMYNAAREETEKETEDGAAGKGVWLLDRKAWNAYLF